jgi:hypothetical protein
MKTNQILANIRSNGGFDNFNKWNRKEIAEWVYSNFNCSKYVANNVSNYLR